MEKYAAVILAAGKGTRMNEGEDSPIPKVMFKVNGEPIIRHAVNAIHGAGVNKVVLVVGYRQDMIRDYFGDEVEYAQQLVQLGTGHAVIQAESVLKNKAENIITFYGDHSLYKSETIKKLIELYENPPAGGKQPTIAMLSVEFTDPMHWAFGRILRDEKGEVIGIREQKDCTKEQLKIKESNPGFYVVEANWFWPNLHNLNNDNSQKEYYLTDIVEMAKKQGKRVIAMPVSEETEAIGINTPEQLKQAEEVLKSR